MIFLFVFRSLAVIFGVGCFSMLWSAETDEIAREPIDAERIFLEQQYGSQATAWADARSAKAAQRLHEDPQYEGLLDAVRGALSAQSTVVAPQVSGHWAFRVDRSGGKDSGTLQVTPSTSLTSENELSWKDVIDLNQFSVEGQSTALRNIVCSVEQTNRCLLSLSAGGADAAMMIEIDIETGQQPADGFVTEAGRGGATWAGSDQLLITLAIEDDERSAADYPMRARLWSRGEPLTDAQPVFEASAEDVGLEVRLFGPPGQAMPFVMQRHTFWDQTWWLVGQDGQAHALSLPRDAILVGLIADQAVFVLGVDHVHDHGVVPKNQVLAASLDALRNGQWESSFETIYKPGQRGVLQDATEAGGGIAIAALENTVGVVQHAQRFEDSWRLSKLDLPVDGAVQLVQSGFSAPVLVSAESFTDPRTIWAADPSANSEKVLARAESLFDDEEMLVERFTAASADGVDIPYVVVRRRDLPMDRGNPTYIYGYGGFQYTPLPFYVGILGRLWLDRGGVYVHAHLRGGGEFGSDWHQAAQTVNRQVAFNDMIAVAEDVIERGYASPETLGVIGGSNGGLMATNMYVQRPDLFAGVVAGGALIDMLAYTRLGAGASWIAEFGDPADASTREVLRRLSPYHQAEADAEYPPIFLTVARNDDRVHPAHARKFAHRLEELGYHPLYFEQSEGGHAGGGFVDVEAANQARIHTFFSQTLDPNKRLSSVATQSLD